MKILNLFKTSKGAYWGYLQNLELQKLGAEVTVILPDDQGEMAKRYIEANMNVIVLCTSLFSNNVFDFFKRILAFRKIVRQENPDIIHSHFVTTTLFARIALIWSKITTPLIFQVPSPLHMEYLLFRMLDICTASQRDYWVGASRKTVEYYKKYKKSKARVFLGYYGVDSSFFNKGERGKLRAEFKIDDDTLLLGMVAYFYKPKIHLFEFQGLKGHEDFIDAFVILKKKIKNVKAIFVGGPWGNSQKYYDKIKEIAKLKAGDDILFAGNRNDIADVYAGIDISVCPSLHENLGAALESLACEVPVVSTNIGGFPDIVIKNVTGITVPKHSPRLLAKAIIRLNEDEYSRKSLARKGKELVKSTLDVKNTAKTMLAIYKMILNSQNRNTQ